MVNVGLESGVLLLLSYYFEDTRPRWSHAIEFTFVSVAYALKLWPNTALDCNHQSTRLPQLQPSYVQLVHVIPQRDEDLGKPAVTEPNIRLTSTQDLYPSGRIQNY